jgi:hypothetical protein
MVMRSTVVAEKKGKMEGSKGGIYVVVAELKP